VNYNDLSAVKEALDQGANPSFIHPKFGWTSIHHAAKLGYTEIIKALLSKSGSNPNVKDRFDETPLHYAVVNSHRNTVEFLASNGADLVQELLDT
jgi:ankyrin repeat protein